MADICHECANPEWTGKTIEAPAMPGGGGEGGTNDFNALDNRPKYGGRRMTGNTNIPDVTNDLTRLENEMADIEGMIPDAASNENQLADKNFVNSSVATNTANFVGTYNSLEELEAVENPSNNDYGFVVATDGQGNTVYNRYKYVASFEEWQFEYALNNSSFTAAQWDAINSAITSGKVAKLDALADIKSIGSNLTLDAETGELSGAEPGIPKRATFWGQPYDDVNERVDGIMTIPLSDSLVPSTQSQGLTIGARNFGGFYPSIWGNTSGVLYLSGNGSVQIGYPSGPGYYGAFSATGLDIKNLKVTNLATPTAAKDATNKQYVDNLVIGYSTKTGTGAPTTATEGEYVGQLYTDTTNQDMYYLAAKTAQGTTPETYEYTWIKLGATVVQTTGTSTASVMSQKAVSNMIYPSGYETSKTRIAIGNGATTQDYAISIGNTAQTTAARSIAIGGSANNSAKASGNDSIAIGSSSAASGYSSVALGSGGAYTPATASHGYSVALGSYSTTGRDSEVSVGTGTSSADYGTRFIANVRDPQLAQDAATKNYVDTVVENVSTVRETTLYL